MENIKTPLVILFISVLVITSYVAGFHFGIGNQTQKFGDGYPKNCRAFISETINESLMKFTTPEEALNKINSGCGLYGKLWKER
jgi:hypothetical protein